MVSFFFYDFLVKNKETCSVKQRVRNNNYAQSEKKINLKSPLFQLPDTRRTFRVQAMQRILIKL